MQLSSFSLRNVQNSSGGKPNRKVGEKYDAEALFFISESRVHVEYEDELSVL